MGQVHDYTRMKCRSFFSFGSLQCCEQMIWTFFCYYFTTVSILICFWFLVFYCLKFVRGLEIIICQRYSNCCAGIFTGISALFWHANGAWFLRDTISIVRVSYILVKHPCFSLHSKWMCMWHLLQRLSLEVHDITKEIVVVYSYWILLLVLLVFIVWCDLPAILGYMILNVSWHLNVWS